MIPRDFKPDCAVFISVDGVRMKSVVGMAEESVVTLKPLKEALGPGS